MKIFTKEIFTKEIFNRRIKTIHRNRICNNSHDDFLFNEISNRLADRLGDFKQTFPNVLELGGRKGALHQEFTKRGYYKTSKVEKLISTDFAYKLAIKANENSDKNYVNIAMDEELPCFSDNSFDLIIANGTLHWVNELPATLIAIKRMLKPDGLFLGAMLGGNSLNELKQVLIKAQIEVTGGVSPNISSFCDIKSIGSLLQNSGFYMPVCDNNVLKVDYKNIKDLLYDLKNMGENNALEQRNKKFTNPNIFNKAIELYNKNKPTIAEFEMIFMHGRNLVIK